MAFAGAKEKKKLKQDFNTDIKRLMFSNDTPVIVSEEIGTFTMVMSTFQQYEKTVSRCMISWKYMQEFCLIVSRLKVMVAMVMW